MSESAADPARAAAASGRERGAVRGRLFVLLQLALPQHRLSRLVFAATRVRTPWFKNLLIRVFLKLFDVDMTEAVEIDPYRYASFNEFFTRALRPDARPIAAGHGRHRQPGRRHGERMRQHRRG